MTARQWVSSPVAKASAFIVPLICISLEFYAWGYRLNALESTAIQYAPPELWPLIRGKFDEAWPLCMGLSIILIGFIIIWGWWPREAVSEFAKRLRSTEPKQRTWSFWGAVGSLFRHIFISIGRALSFAWHMLIWVLSWAIFLGTLLWFLPKMTILAAPLAVIGLVLLLLWLLSHLGWVRQAIATLLEIILYLPRACLEGLAEHSRFVGNMLKKDDELSSGRVPGMESRHTTEDDHDKQT